MATIEQVTYNSPDGATMGKGASELISFYGVTPVSQRASSVQVSSAVVTSASFGTLQVAQIQQIYNTLAGLGLWKGGA